MAFPIMSATTGTVAMVRMSRALFRLPLPVSRLAQLQRADLTTILMFFIKFDFCRESSADGWLSRSRWLLLTSSSLGKENILTLVLLWIKFSKFVTIMPSGSRDSFWFIISSRYDCFRPKVLFYCKDIRNAEFILSVMFSTENSHQKTEICDVNITDSIIYASKN